MVIGVFMLKQMFQQVLAALVVYFSLIIYHPVPVRSKTPWKNAQAELSDVAMPDTLTC